MSIAFLAGTNLLGHPPFQASRIDHVITPYGQVTLHRGENWALVLRHGPDGAVSPHSINYHAHVSALHGIGCRQVVSFCSVGGLRPPRTRPGTLMVPDDYINLWPVLTFFERDPPYVTPMLDEPLRQELLAALRLLDEDFVAGGVYYQSGGPRLETRAEVRMIAAFADVVGMTFGHEATLCAEAGLAVAAVCSVDNLAHGLDSEPLLAHDILRRKTEQGRRFANIAARLLLARAQAGGRPVASNQNDRRSHDGSTAD
jgi:5'-methylthioadenosine phosphorylase